MQQQPKKALKDRDGNELFHPRKMFIADDDYVLAFCDESQMELRVQANYTVLVGHPDFSLCNAYEPFDCVHYKTGEQFENKNKENKS